MDGSGPDADNRGNRFSTLKGDSSVKQAFIVLFISCALVIGAAVLFTQLMAKKASEMGIKSTPTQSAPAKP
jgi:hypothetical protein